MPQPTSPKVFVIILNYNGKDCIKACLDSIYRQTYLNIETIVVDNASKDGSFELAKRLFPKMHFILNPGNLGFAAGNNVGIRFALEKMADYVLLLNNDATLEKNALQTLVKEAEKLPQGGIFSPLVYNGQGNKVWFAGGEILWRKMKTLHTPAKSATVAYTTEFISGCAMLIKKDVFQKIGLIDETYFLYYEDTDFSLRAKKEGFALYIVPTAKAFHMEKSAANSSAKTYWLVLSALIFFRKHSPLFVRSWHQCYLFLRQLKNKRDLRQFRKSAVALAVRRAYDDFNIYKRSH